MNIEQSIAAIEQWAHDRNLIKGATSQAQTVKLFEEGGEVAHAVARNDRVKLKDGIGDMVVVLTILARQNCLTLEDCVAAAYDEIKDRTGRMVDGVFVKDESDGWIKWGGGECPVDAFEKVGVRWWDSAEIIEEYDRAKMFDWHVNGKANDPSEGDIIAYRVVKS